MMEKQSCMDVSKVAERSRTHACSKMCATQLTNAKKTTAEAAKTPLPPKGANGDRLEALAEGKPAHSTNRMEATLRPETTCGAGGQSSHNERLSLGCRGGADDKAHVPAWYAAIT